MVTRRQEQAGLISTAISLVLLFPFKIQNQTKALLCIFNEIMSNNFWNYELITVLWNHLIYFDQYISTHML